MYRRLLLAACGFVAALSVATVTHAASHPPIFAPPVPVDAYPNAGPGTIGDVDSDGNPDLVTLAGTSDGAIAVQLGNGDGTFQSKRLYSGGPGCVGIGKVTIADLTGDGTPDLAVACLFPNSVEVLPGPLPEPRLPDFPEDVPGTVLYATGDQPMALLVGHLDGPGDPDLVVANGDGTVSVLLADGNGGFQPKVDYPAGGGMPSPGLALGDVDGNGHLDVVVANQQANTVSVLLGSGDGTFQPATSFGDPFSPLFYPTALALGDLDGDGDLDLVVGQWSGLGLTVFLGNGDGTFVALSPLLLPFEVREQSVVVTEIDDLNFDGNADVVVGLASTGAPGDVDYLGVLVGVGGGTFSELADYPLGIAPGAFPAGAAVGDLNLDGRPDLAVSVEGLWTLLNTMGPQTPPGSTVVVVPVDSQTGDTPVTITFTDVSAAGQTTLESFDTEPRQFYLATTATFAIAEVCFSYAAPPAPTIILYDAGAGIWTAPPQSDTGNAVCVDVVNPLPANAWALVQTSGPQTPAGQDVSVNPIDPTTGTTPVTITFADVTAAGETTVTSSSTGPAMPSGFELASVYYELTTTALFSGSVEVCFPYTQPRPPDPQILHWDGAQWIVEPITRDTGTEVCAEVTSFSPFVLVIPASGQDTTAPTIACGSADADWHADNVSIACTAGDNGSGLADPAEAAFSLLTSVAAGDEDGNASTGTHQVCDLAGNCVTAGPVTGNKIDRRAPALSLPADITVDATSPAGATVVFSATATDGGDPNPRVTCTPASESTFAVGTTTVTCTATDHVANQAEGSFAVTVLEPPGVPTCDGKVATIVGAPGPTEIRGTLGNDVIVDLDGNTIVRGRGGNDTVCTGTGNDQVYLGAGADRVIDTGGTNTIEGGAGPDIITAGNGADAIHAGAGADTIVDTGGDNTVDGAAGNDAITTGAGDDHVEGGIGNDTVDAGGGDNAVNGQAGNDTITTGAGDDTIDGGAGRDTCSPGSGQNVVSRCEP